MAATPKAEFGIGETMALFMKQIEQDIKSQMDFVVESKSVELEMTLGEMRRNIETNTAKLAVTVSDSTHVVEGIRHKQLPSLILIVAQRLPVLIVGMAGTGKTHSAEQTAEALGLPFYAMSVGAQTSKSDILGYMHAGGGYVRSLFREAYEHGGVFLMDEIDAGNANVLIQVNAALSNNYCAFPNGMVKRHGDFVFVASGNTYGNGANRQYVGRNQLDAATLDRFVILDWEIDEELEAVLAGPDPEAKSWHQAMKRLRARAAEEKMRVLVTPRATLRGATLLAAGVSVEEVAELSVLRLFPPDKMDWARKIIKGGKDH